jgi:hypothetical protein
MLRRVIVKQPVNSRPCPHEPRFMFPLAMGLLAAGDFVVSDRVVAVGAVFMAVLVKVLMELQPGSEAKDRDEHDRGDRREDWVRQHGVSRRGFVSYYGARERCVLVLASV